MRRLQLIDTRVAEQNRLRDESVKQVRKSLEESIDWLKRQIKKLDVDLERKIKNSPTFSGQNDLIQSVPGIGPNTANMIMACLPEVRHPQSPGHRIPGWRRAPQPRQRQNQRQAILLGRTGRGARGAIHGRPGGRTLQPGHQGNFSKTQSQRQTREDCTGGLHAEIVGHFKHHDP